MDTTERIYHHVSTSLPMTPRALVDCSDSEDEASDKLFNAQTGRLIDEFTDVNDGEKEIMKMWNIHMNTYKYVADCQMPMACLKFVEDQGKTLVQKNLYRNFVVHLTTLFDFGLLSSYGVYTTILALHKEMKENNSTVTALRDYWKANMPPDTKQDQPSPGPVPEQEISIPENELPGPSIRASRRISRNKNWHPYNCCAS